jgi:dihydropteroate synthase
MGILNRTPDSFYDRGRYMDLDAALQRARAMIAEGADIIDVGGEKAGPGEPVTPEEEIERVIPAIERIRRETDIAISVDTFKPEVAEAALGAGADIINSIGGFGDPAMRQVAARSEAGVVIMHIQGEPRVRNVDPQYADVVEEVRNFLVDRAEACVAAGIAPERIVIDPGPGFGKTAFHDLTLLRNLSRLTSLPFPLLLAVSRKPFVGSVLGTEVEDRLEGSLAVAVWGVMRGAAIIRTHDVRATRRVCLMTEAVLAESA